MRQLLKDNIVIVKNFLSLSLLNVINFLTPIITLPYLIEILGADGYGKYAFSYSIIIYILMLVNFGFNFSATKDVALNKNNNYSLSRIFTEVFLIRLGLAAVGLLAIALLFYQIPKFNDTLPLILSGSGVIFGTVMLPNYLFQGVEKMKYITLGTAIPKFVMISSIFYLIKSKEDLELLMLIQSFGFLMAGGVGTFIAIKTIRVRFVAFSKKNLVLRMRNSLNLFFSTLGMSLYRESGTIILGAFTNFEITGFYSAAEKIIRACQALLNPVAQSIFPHFASKFGEALDKKKSAIQNLIKFAKYYALFLVFVVVVLVIFIPYTIQFFAGGKYDSSILNIRLLSPLILFGSLSYVIGIVGLVNLGYDKYFTKGVLISGVIAVLSGLISVRFFEDIGVAISVSIAEVFLFFFLFRKFNTIK